MENIMEIIKFLFLNYIAFAIYTIVATFVIVGVLPMVSNAITSPFIWLKRKLFGD